MVGAGQGGDHLTLFVDKSWVRAVLRGRVVWSATKLGRVDWVGARACWRQGRGGSGSEVRRTGGFKEVGRKGGSVALLGACCEPFRGVSRKSRLPLSNNLVLTPGQAGGFSEVYSRSFFFNAPRIFSVCAIHDNNLRFALRWVELIRSKFLSLRAAGRRGHKAGRIVSSAQPSQGPALCRLTASTLKFIFCVCVTKTSQSQ